MLLHPLALLLPLIATAGDPEDALFEGLSITKVFDRVEVTHYSATPADGNTCDYEGGVGGPDESPSGFRPLSHRIDKPGPIYGRPAVLTAVTQHGGTRSAYRCFFALPDAYPGKLFFGGDFYGPDSDDAMKTDISSPCTSIVNVTKHSRMVVYDCGAQAARVGPLYNANMVASAKLTPPSKQAAQVAKQTRPPKKIAPPEPKEEPVAGECLWYAVASCDRNKEDLQRDQAHLGEDFKIVRTDSISGFSRGWYCLVSGSKDREGAAEKVRSAKGKVSSPYVKKGC